MMIIIIIIMIIIITIIIIIIITIVEPNIIVPVPQLETSVANNISTEYPGGIFPTRVSAQRVPKYTKARLRCSCLSSYSIKTKLLRAKCVLVCKALCRVLLISQLQIQGGGGGGGGK